MRRPTHTTWFKDQRHAWILESLRIYGFINREHVMAKFGVSTPQASKDLNEVLRLCPDLMRYNLSTKRYERISK